MNKAEIERLVQENAKLRAVLENLANVMQHREVMVRKAKAVLEELK